MLPIFMILGIETKIIHDVSTKAYDLLHQTIRQRHKLIIDFLHLCNIFLA